MDEDEEDRNITKTEIRKDPLDEEICPILVWHLHLLMEPSGLLVYCEKETLKMPPDYYAEMEIIKIRKEAALVDWQL